MNTIKVIKTFEIINNMVKSSIVKGSSKYKLSKFMCLLNMKDRLYFNVPFRQHIEDIEQTLIDYGFKDEKFFSALWVANSDIPFKKRLEIFGRDIVRLSFGFSRTNIFKNRINTTNSNIKKPKDVTTLILAQRISNINYTINNRNSDVFDMYVKSYPYFKESLISDEKEHEKMWNYLELCCVKAGSLNALFFHI